jgi:hypothetical protein
MTRRELPLTEVSFEDMVSACSLDDASLHERRGAWTALAGAALSSERSEGGVTAIYRGDANTYRALASLVEAERACCSHLSWKLTPQGDTVRLDVAPI